MTLTENNRSDTKRPSASSDGHGVGEGPGAGYVGVIGIAIISCVLFVITFFTAYTMIALWPNGSETGDEGNRSDSGWLWWQVNASNETRLFVIVVCATQSALCTGTSVTEI
jgi:hypothetical protein